MALQVVRFNGPVSSNTYAEFITTDASCLVSTDIGQTGGAFSNTTYWFALDYWNVFGRSTFNSNGGSSASSFVMGVAGNKFRFTVAIKTGWSGVGLYGFISGSSYYHYADVGLDGSITYFNGASSGVSVVSISGNQITIDVTALGPTTTTTGYDGNVFGGVPSGMSSGNYKEDIITVPAGETWLMKSVHLQALGYHPYRILIDDQPIIPSSTSTIDISTQVNPSVPNQIWFYTNSSFHSFFNTYPGRDTGGWMILNAYNNTISTGMGVPAIMEAGQTIKVGTTSKYGNTFGIVSNGQVDYRIVGVKI